MEFVRIIKDSADLEKFLDIPPSLRNKKLELIILPYADSSNIDNESNKSLKGALRKYKNKSLLSQEGDAWRQAVTDCHEDH